MQVDRDGLIDRALLQSDIGIVDFLHDLLTFGIIPCQANTLQ